MTRPTRGSAEWDLWVAAIDVAIFPPLQAKGATMQVSARRIAALREALDGLGLDWRTAKEKDDDIRVQGGRRVDARNRQAAVTDRNRRSTCN